MSSSAETYPNTGVAVPKVTAPALFTLDSAGFVLSANHSADKLWQTLPGGLLQKSVADLFATDSSDTDGASAWDALLAASLNTTAARIARVSDTLAIPVQVTLEEAQGESARYFACVHVPQAHAREPAAPVIVDSGLALLADQGAVGFFDLNFKAEQVYYSPAWKRILGYNETDVANTYDTWLRLLHPDDSAAAPDHMGRRQAHGVRSFAVEVRMLHRSGHYVWVHCLGTQVFGAHGDLERVTGLQVDISERKELEELSLLNEERVQRLSEEGELTLFDLNFAAQEFWLSPNWHRVVGPAPLTGAGALNAFVECLPPEQAVQGAHSFFVEPNVGQPTFIKTMPLRKPDNTSFTAVFGAHRQLSRKGELLRAVGFICALPHSTMELAATPFPASLVEPTLESLNEAFLIADSRGHVLYLNERAAGLTGFTAEAAHGRNVEDVFRLVDQASGSACPGALEAALSSTDETRLNGQHAILTRDQEEPRPIVWSARRVVSAGGTPRALILVFRDPEEMSLTPEELLRINRFETLGVVAGGISHDFNNLLTTILGGISQAKDNNDDTYLADSERACLAAKALTKQLLAIAKGGKSESLQSLAVAEILRDAVRLARAGSNADIRIDAPETIAPVSADRSQILQVFQNLIINALQALPGRGGALRVAATNVVLANQELGALPAGNYVRVDLRDNGCGIAPENLEKIFEPFFTTKKHGTGLGLSMVRTLVRKHGGDVTVASKVGEGTTFHVYLPQATASGPKKEVRAAPSLRFGTGRVLLMDDDPDICHLAEGMLASLDYKYDIVRTGEEAVALYRRYLNVGRPYDAVLLDLTVVGGAGGEETFHQLRELDPQVRAIVCSGYDNEEMIEHYTQMGFSGYLTKPFRVGDLGKVLKSVAG